MKRRQFVQIPLAVSALAANSLSDEIKQARNEVLVNAGNDRDGKPFEFLDATFQVKVSGKDTEGRCVIFDTIRHKKVGPALHIHKDCDGGFLCATGSPSSRWAKKSCGLRPGTL